MYNQVISLKVCSHIVYFYPDVKEKVSWSIRWIMEYKLNKLSLDLIKDDITFENNKLSVQKFY